MYVCTSTRIQDRVRYGADTKGHESTEIILVVYTGTRLLGFVPDRYTSEYTSYLKYTRYIMFIHIDINIVLIVCTYY